MWKRRSSPSKESWLPSQPLQGSSPTIRSIFKYILLHAIPASCLWWSINSLTSLSLQEMNQWWVDDLPLPLPQTTYKWARDHSMLVTLFSKYLQMGGKLYEPPQYKWWKCRNKSNSSRTSWVCQLPWLWTIVALRSVFGTTSSRASTSPVLTTGALFFSFFNSLHIVDHEKRSDWQP